MTTHLAELNGPLAKLADAHCVVSKNYDADFLAVAWYRLAPLPGGRWAVQYGLWAQGMGTADFPWGECRDAAEGTAWFVAAAKDLCHRDVEGGLARVQEKARRRLWAKIERDHLTSAEGAAPEPTLDGTLPPVPSSVVELAWAHRRELFALARRVTGDRHLAEDAVQDALLGVHKYGPSKDPDRPFLPWLRAVVLNAARTRVRKKAPAPQSDRLPDPADDRADHEGVVERAELFARIKAATWELEPLSRKVFRLCYLDGLTHAEVARRVRRKVGSVQGLVCRARKALRARLALPPEPAIG